MNDDWRVGAEPPFSVAYIDPKVCGGKRDQWFAMGTVAGDPRSQCGPVAICEYEPSAHVIADLLNRSTHCESCGSVLDDNDECPRWQDHTIKPIDRTSLTVDSAPVIEDDRAVMDEQLRNSKFYRDWIAQHFCTCSITPFCIAHPAGVNL